MFLICPHIHRWKKWVDLGVKPGEGRVCEGEGAQQGYDVNIVYTLKPLLCSRE